MASLVLIPVGLVSTVLAWRLSRDGRLASRYRVVWQMLAAGLLLAAVGDVWSIGLATSRGRDLAITAADAPYLLSYLVIIAATLCLIEGRPSRGEVVTLTLDASMVAVGGGLVIWHTVIVPAYRAVPADALSRLVSLAYPVGDLLLLTGLAVVLLRCQDDARRRVLLLLAGSLGAMLLGNLLWIYEYTERGWLVESARDVCFLTHYALFIASVEVERRQLGREVEDVRTPVVPMALLPYAAVIGGYALLLSVAWRGADEHTFQLTLGALILTMLVTARQIVALRENVALQRERVVMSGEARFRSLVQHASDVVSIVDVHGVASFVSPSATATLGYTPETIIGTSILALLHPDDAVDAGRRLEDVVSTGRSATGRWRMQRKDGTWIQTDSICTNLMSDENVRGLVLTTRDISERCALEAQLLHQAFHDPLTGLANRALFLDRVRHALARRQHGSDGLGILFIDLDQFKTVNDSLGHQVGDLLLRGVADRLASGLRCFDTIARLGGDEFAVLIDDAEGDDGVMVIADRVGQALRDPFLLEGREVVTLASIGVALVHADQSAEDLLRNADLAMYLAKNRGGGQTALFEPEMHAAMLNRLELQADLRRALEREEFSLVYQPVHALETQALVGVEALLRWAHPTRGSVPPGVFIPIAEQTGLIVPIGKWVIEQACRDAREWRNQLGEIAPQSVAVNISGRQIPEPALFDDIQAALARAELPPSALVLELTESILLTHTDQTLSVMHRLKDIGVGLALDDFGTGYSSLSYLQRLPIDVLKIDRAFVERLETDASASALTRAIVGLGKTLSLRTVAEGVENRTQADLLQHLGCDHGQGFLYGMPMPTRELQRYARRVRKFVAA
jgi:diguanylate cyclase (GGDEF)-like protein/PAS domain S-box-containing protein